MNGLLLLLRRHLQTSVGATLALAVVAMLAAVALSAVPRAVGELHSRQLVHETRTASPITRDVIATGTGVAGYVQDAGSAGGTIVEDGPTHVTPPPPDWDGYLAGLESVRAAQPEPLRSVLGEPDLSIALDPFTAEVVPGNDIRVPQVILRSAPHIDENARIVDGRWPRATPLVVDPGLLLPGPDGVVDVEQEPIEVALSEASAEVLGWEVGDVHRLDDVSIPEVRLVGVWRAVDPDGDYWQHNGYAVRPQVVDDLNVGKIATAAAYVDSAMLGAPWLGTGTRMWFPTDTEGVDSADVPVLLSQLRGLTSRTATVLEGDPLTFRPSSGLTDTLERVLGQRTGVDALLAVVAAGPLGAVLAVLFLGARLVVDRRREALALVRARGASLARLRLLVAAEGIVTGLPAAALGLALGLVLVPGGLTVTQVALAALAGLAPAAVLAASVSAPMLRPVRADLGGRSGSRVRWILEVLVLVSAAVTTWLLLQRGVVAGSGAEGATGVDPLLAAAPLLLCAAGTVAAVRAFPWLARGLEKTLSQRRDLVPFLGAARATRDPAGGIVPALALVLCVAVAASSAVLQATVTGGITHQAWSTVGADMRVAGPLIGDEEATALRAVEGVAGVARIADLGGLSLRVNLSGRQVDVFAVDAEELARVQEGVPGAPDGLAQLSAPGDRLPVLASGVEGVDVGATGLSLAGQDVADLDVVGIVDGLPGLPPTTSFLVVDASRAAELLGVDAYPRLGLLSLDDEADATATASAVRDLLPTAVVDDPVAGERALLASPSAGGLAAAFTIAVALAALLCAGTVILTLVLATPARARLLTVLRTLGLRRADARGLVGWEIGPWAAVALLVGAVLGWAVPALVLATVDLTPLTGGERKPDLQVDPLMIGALAVGFVLVVVTSTAVVARIGRRGDPGRLREGAS